MRERLDPLVPESSATITYSEADNQDYIFFVDQVRKLTGIDLAQYKEAQMRRRLTTLRIKNGYSSFQAFFEGIKQDKRLLAEFLDRMTINVSEFWRNPLRWITLKERVLPMLTETNRRLHCWSAACSTGEEPYTLAMILDDAGLLQQARVDASDLDDNALARAKDAWYVERSLKDVPVDFKQRYFKEDQAGYRIEERLKRSIQYRKQNLLTDRFESNLDLIICRNVMIYFTEEAKHDLYMKFAQSLRPGGVLFVGSTEQIFNPGQYGLETMETFFYRRTSAKL
ncbi:CheR family methyltransferase [Paenibacillus sp. 481]|uniref:CheR family methyltransferase n=1 Tax=Paenibacillus sp. 481 TaxID=2835869 RepID=UPI001E41705B|nr:protein-glutamate O-methyltransferase CheR [Paenibacillus sp. 481]UHA72964.1 protein-glutamate O-methyltransferase CheR [Paenibacillus sp. 481]